MITMVPVRSHRMAEVANGGHVTVWRSAVVQHLRSVDDCAKNENLYSLLEAVPGPAGCFLSRTGSYALILMLKSAKSSLPFNGQYTTSASATEAPRVPVAL